MPFWETKLGLTEDSRTTNSECKWLGLTHFILNQLSLFAHSKQLFNELFFGISISYESICKNVRLYRAAIQCEMG